MIGISISKLLNGDSSHFDALTESAKTMSLYHSFRIE
jgi:hypothetical protein